jgi:uncharacterized protein YegL
MNDALRLRLEELTDNPSARVPICLTLDTSGSMSGAKIKELNAAIQWFFDEVKRDEQASISAEIAIVSFGSQVTKVADFSGVDRLNAPILKAHGSTAMGLAVTDSLALLEKEKRRYSEMGIEYFQPWLVLMTDGEPSDDITESVRQCADLIARKKLTVFPVAIGAEANLATLGMFAPNVEPLRVGSDGLRKFFRWLVASIKTQSMSNAGDKASASLGETEFRKASKGWDSVFNPRSS